MQQTETYKFKLIETSDPFSPDAINDHARQLEAALLGHKAETDAALSQHEGAVAAALASHKTDTDAALARQAETVVQCQEQNCLFKLGGPTALAADGEITFSLTGVDMSQYAALLLVYTLNKLRASTVLYLNGKEVATLLTTSSVSSGVTACTVVMPHLLKNVVAAQTFFLNGFDEYGKTATITGGAAGGMDWNGVKSLKLVNADYAVLYGLKK